MKLNSYYKILMLLLLLLILILFFKPILNTTENFVDKQNKQLRFKNALEDMADILEENKIKYILYCGTALGAHREKQFIEHDPDIDLGTFDNVPKIWNALKKSSKFKLKNTLPKNVELNEVKEISYMHLPTNTKIDIFKIEKKGDKYAHYTYYSICDKKENRRCEFINSINLTHINFLGRKYLIPDTTFLVSQYGKDWNIVKRYSYEEGLKNKLYASLK